eukprot:PhM_4_TR18678/c1_g1_i2/m.71218
MRGEYQAHVVGVVRLRLERVVAVAFVVGGVGRDHQDQPASAGDAVHTAVWHHAHVLCHRLHRRGSSVVSLVVPLCVPVLHRPHTRRRHAHRRAQHDADRARVRHQPRGLHAQRDRDRRLQRFRRTLIGPRVVGVRALGVLRSQRHARGPVPDAVACNVSLGGVNITHAVLHAGAARPHELPAVDGCAAARRAPHTADTARHRRRHQQPRPTHALPTGVRASACGVAPGVRGERRLQRRDCEARRGPHLDVGASGAERGGLALQRKEHGDVPLAQPHGPSRPHQHQQRALRHIVRDAHRARTSPAALRRVHVRGHGHGRRHRLRGVGAHKRYAAAATVRW